jgi:CspA family cold shock protein
VATGTVKSFNPARHYGFIRVDSSGVDVFVHRSEIQRSGLSCLRKGQKLSFEILENQGKPRARNLRINDAMTAKTSIVSRNELAQTSATHAQIDREAIALDALQSVIADTVRRSGQNCEGFIDVFIERIPATRGGANWEIKGVKYGRADRTLCDAAIAEIVEHYQRKFSVVREEFGSD